MLQIFLKNKIFQQLQIILIYLLVFFLPLHGSLTIFFPAVRCWKEIFLLLIFFLQLLNFLQSKIYFFKYVVKKGLIEKFKNFFYIFLYQEIKKKLFKLMSEVRPASAGRTSQSRVVNIFQKPETWAIFFLFWLGFLFLIHPEKKYAIIAARYLGINFFVFITIFFSLLSISKNFDLKKITQNIIKFFIVSCLISTIFGIWAKFAGGNNFLENFYSTTLSSWVPGQKIPLYHESYNFIRMQGTSSGPIEFSHLLLIGFCLLFFLNISKKIQKLNFSFFGLRFVRVEKKVLSKNCKFSCQNFFIKFMEKNYIFKSIKIFIGLIFCFGIFQSFSRAAILGLFIFLFFYFLFKKKSSKKFLFLHQIYFSVSPRGARADRKVLKENFKFSFQVKIFGYLFNFGFFKKNKMLEVWPAPAGQTRYRWGIYFFLIFFVFILIFQTSKYIFRNHEYSEFESVDVLKVTKNKIENFLLHSGDHLHFSRPIQALRLGIKNPIFGALAQIGPAARKKNLDLFYNDQALISENVFIDYFTQTGFFGIFFVLCFFFFLFKNTSKKYWAFIFTIIFLMNLASIFDMTPISIICFLFFALFYVQKYAKI